MNLKKKLAMAMAVAAVCCSIGAPAVANAGEARACEHPDWRTEVTRDFYTERHAYSVGDDKYQDCVISVTEITTRVYCGGCGYEKSVTTETTTSHSACGR